MSIFLKPNSFVSRLFLGCESKSRPELRKTLLIFVFLEILYRLRLFGWVEKKDITTDLLPVDLVFTSTVGVEERVG